MCVYVFMCVCVCVCVCKQPACKYVCHNTIILVSYDRHLAATTTYKNNIHRHETTVPSCSIVHVAI